MGAVTEGAIKSGMPAGGGFHLLPCGHMAGKADRFCVKIAITNIHWRVGRMTGLALFFYLKMAVVLRFMTINTLKGDILFGWGVLGVAIFTADRCLMLASLLIDNLELLLVALIALFLCGTGAVWQAGKNTGVNK